MYAPVCLFLHVTSRIERVAAFSLVLQTEVLLFGPEYNWIYCDVESIKEPRLVDYFRRLDKDNFRIEDTWPEVSGLNCK